MEELVEADEGQVGGGRLGVDGALAGEGIVDACDALRGKER